MSSKLLFLGYMISNERIHVDEEKMRAIRDWSTPMTVTKSQNFHQFVTFYRYFIQNFSSIMVPIIKCLKKENFH